MIGTTFKLGFDGSSVSRGLGSLAGKIKGSIGRIGVGAMERVGHRVTDLMGRIVMGIPDALNETLDWAGGLTDMSAATNMSISDLVVLEEKFRLAGVSAKESGAVMSRFSMKLKEAATEGGEAAEALRDLGFNGQTFKDENLADSFDEIMKKFMILGPEMENVEKAMGTLFGSAKIGYQLLKLSGDFDAVTLRAEKNVRKLGNALDAGGSAKIFDEWGDALGRFEAFKRAISTIALDEIINIFGGVGGPDKFFDLMDPMKFREKFRSIVEELIAFVENFSSNGGFSGMLDKLGNSIGESIGAGIKKSIGFKGFFSSGPAGSNKEEKEVPDLLEKQNTILTQIRDESAVSRFA